VISRRNKFRRPLLPESFSFRSTAIQKFQLKGKWIDNSPIFQTYSKTITSCKPPFAAPSNLSSNLPHPKPMPRRMNPHRFPTPRSPLNHNLPTIQLHKPSPIPMITPTIRRPHLYLIPLLQPARITDLHIPFCFRKVFSFDDFQSFCGCDFGRFVCCGCGLYGGVETLYPFEDSGKLGG